VLNIILPANATTQTIRIMDVAGKMVMQQKNVKRTQTLDVSALPNGLYFLQLAEGTKSTYRKFIVNK
jgi:hypothetical protein